MATKDGSTVLQGVDWWTDDKTITVQMAPASCNKGLDYKQRYKRTWLNECPYCKKKKGAKYEGVLYAHGTIRGKLAPEGEITCRSCDTDFDGVSGKSKEGSCRYSLTAGSGDSSTAQSAEQAVLTRKEALFKLKEEYKDRRFVTSKQTITIPVIPGLKKGDYIRLDPPLGDKKKYYVSSVQIKIDSMTLEIHDKFPEPPTKYTEKYEEKSGG